MLEEQCLKRQDAILRGHAETIGERLLRDLDALMPLPPAPYDACEKVSTRASSISMVRYRPAATITQAPTTRTPPVAPAYSRPTPSLRLGPPANSADGAGQLGCRSSRRAITAISRSPRAVTTSAASASSPACAGRSCRAHTRR